MDKQFLPKEIHHRKQTEISIENCSSNCFDAQLIITDDSQFPSKQRQLLAYSVSGFTRVDYKQTLLKRVSRRNKCVTQHIKLKQSIDCVI